MEDERKPTLNRYQLAIEVLQKGREVLMQDLADHIIDRAEDFAEGGFLFQEFLENQGSKLHFLYLMLSQLEQSAEQFDDSLRTTSHVSENLASGNEACELEPHFFEMTASEPFPPFEDLPEDVEPPAEPKPRKRKRKSKKIDTKSTLTSPSDEGE